MVKSLSVDRPPCRTSPPDTVQLVCPTWGSERKQTLRRTTQQKPLDNISSFLLLTGL